MANDVGSLWWCPVCGLTSSYQGGCGCDVNAYVAELRKADNSGPPFPLVGNRSLDGTFTVRTTNALQNQEEAVRPTWERMYRNGSIGLETGWHWTPPVDAVTSGRERLGE